MSKLPNDCIFFLYFQVGWGRGGVVWGWLYLINSLQKNADSHPAVLLNSFKFCAPVVFDWFWLFFSCLRRRLQRYKRGSDITILFPGIAFYFYYHKMNLLYSFIISKILVYIFNSFFLTNPWNSIEKGCHANCVTFLAFLTTYFDEKKNSGKRYFNHILWAPAYNNNTLPDTGISSNKI
jgi:hypothetical protein